MISVHAGAGPFPIPSIPMPMKPRSASRRVQQRFNHKAAVIGLANDCLSSLNLLSSCFATYIPFASHANSSFLQQRFSDFVFDCADRFVRRRDWELRMHLFSHECLAKMHGVNVLKDKRCILFAPVSQWVCRWAVVSTDSGSDSAPYMPFCGLHVGVWKFWKHKDLAQS